MGNSPWAYEVVRPVPALNEVMDREGVSWTAKGVYGYLNNQSVPLGTAEIPLNGDDTLDEVMLALYELWRLGLVRQLTR